MKKINLFFLFVSLIAFVSCEKNEDVIAISNIDYVSFETGFNIGVDPTGTASQEVKIFTSQVASADRSFTISVVADQTSASASTYTVPASVTVPANSNAGVFNIDVDGASIDPNGDTLTLEFMDSEGLFVGDPITLNLEQVCPNPETFLDIVFDSYSAETSWDIKDSSGTVLYSAAYAGSQTDASHKFCLPNGTYTFTIYDVYSDGICCTYGNGSYTLTNNGNVIKTGGSFGASEATEFTLSN